MKGFLKKEYLKLNSVCFVCFPLAGKTKMSLKFARRWAQVYFFLEIVWILYWAATIIAYLAGIGEDGEFYRTIAHLHAFHLVLLPSVAYTMSDGEWHILLGYLGVVITDNAILWDVVFHTPAVSKPIEWAFITSVVRGGFALFITLFVLLWFLYVWYNKIEFKVKGTTKDKPEEAGIPLLNIPKFRLK